MPVGVAFVLMGGLWLAFRKPIARQQYQIVQQILGKGQASDEDRTIAFEHIGLLFSILLLAAGGLILILEAVLAT